MFTTIRSRVLLLGASILLPAVIALSIVSTFLALSQRHAIEVERLSVANNLTITFDRELAGHIGSLATIAVLPEVFSGDFAKAKTDLNQIRIVKGLAELAILNPQGRQIFTTSEAGHESPTISSSEILSLAKGRVYVSGIRPDPTPLQSTYDVAMPIYDGAQLRFIVVATIPSKPLQALFAEAGMPPNWVAAVVDRDGNFVARSISADALIGKPARPELITVAKSDRSEGEFENTTIEGLKAVNSFRRSSISGWTAVSAVPRETIRAPFQRAMWLVGGGSLIIAVLGTLVGLYFARQISKPVEALSAAARALQNNRPLPKVQTSIEEISCVQQTMVQAFGKLGHLAAIVDATGDAIFSADFDGNCLSWNRGAENLFGYSAEEMVGHPVARLYPPDRLSEAQENVAVVMAGQSTHHDTVRRHKDGSMIDVWVDLSPIYGADGTVIAKSTIARDISERKKSEQIRQLLMLEVTHRSKNLLAVVASMAEQTYRSASNAADFKNNFIQRIRGLAASTDLVVKQDWQAIPLDELVDSQLKLFIGDHPHRATISGPLVNLDHQACQALGLAFHELATNCVKYGAWSTADGKVSINWSATADDHIELTWEEIGGPPITETPSRKGFGTVVIERLVASSLNGTVDIAYLPSGLRWTLRFPRQDNS